MSDVVVRPMGPDDAGPLGAVDRATWSTTTSPAPAPEAFHADAATRVLVAERAGEVVGYVQHRPPTPLAANAHVRLVCGLAVSPAHQGAGIARELVEAAVADAAATGATRVRLHVLAANHAARGLYAACGFVEEGVLRGEFRLDGELVDDVLMVRAVPSRAVHPPGG